MLSREVCLNCHERIAWHHSKAQAMSFMGIRASWRCPVAAPAHSGMVDEEHSPPFRCPHKFEHAVAAGLS